MPAPLPEKPCTVCGRTIRWRKKWERNWDEIRVCSDACRRSKLDATDAALEAAITQVLATRRGGATMCPSEAARIVSPDAWEGLMERARCAARRMVARSELEITQGGKAVDPSTAKGPIRLRKV